MRGHGRLLRGLTPAQTADDVLGARPVLEHRPVIQHPASKRPTVDIDVYREAVQALWRAERKLRIAEVCCAVSGTACAVLVGLRLLGW